MTSSFPKMVTVAAVAIKPKDMSLTCVAPGLKSNLSSSKRKESCVLWAVRPGVYPYAMPSYHNK